MAALHTFQNSGKLWNQSTKHAGARSRVASRAMQTPMAVFTSSKSKDMLIVGPGVLGSYAGKLWNQSYPEARVLAMTNTTNHHERLMKLGLHPVLKDGLPAGDRFPYMLFSAPPSGSADYVGEVAAALTLWNNTIPGSCFVFTSSMGICSVDDGSVVREDCPLVPLGAGPNTDKLLEAEQLVIKAGGNVVRLVGLYHAQRGAHTFFLKTQRVQRPGDYIVNLLHYEDAASLTTHVLAGAGGSVHRQCVFLGSDNNPVTFRDMMDACMKNPMFAGQPPVEWLVPDQGPNKSKRVDNSATRLLLGGWKPKYDSFVSFMTEHEGKDFYTNSGLF